MKAIIYTLLSAMLITFTAAETNAQTWRGKHNGLPTGFNAKTIYGEGTNILISNSSAFSGHQMYYTPDSSTPYNFSPSTLGSFATPESNVVKCMGVLFVGSSAGLYKSHDNGQTWASAGAGIIYALYSHNDTLYAGMGPGMTKMSVDTGNTWISCGLATSFAVSFLEQNGTLYVGTTNGLQYTHDFGATWLTVSTPASMTAISIVDIVALGNAVYAACSNGVYSSTDDGRTWTNVLAQDMFCLMVADTSMFGGTAAHGIYRSDNNGGNWTTVNTGLPPSGGLYNTVNHIASNDNFLICSAGGDSAIYVVGLGELGLGAPPGALNNQSISKEGIITSVFPNPAKNEATITLGKSAPDEIFVNLLDITGRNLKSATGFNTIEVKLDLNEVPSGVYLIQIVSGTGIIKKKLVVTK